MVRYDYGNLDNGQIKEVQKIQREMKSCGNDKGITTSDSKPKNVNRFNNDYIDTGISVAKEIFKLFI